VPENAWSAYIRAVTEELQGRVEGRVRHAMPSQSRHQRLRIRRVSHSGALCREQNTSWSRRQADRHTARHGTARHGTARHGTARHGTARHGTARHGTA
jgi:hypothetical protein